MSAWFCGTVENDLARKKTPAVVKESDEGMNEPGIFSNLFKGPRSGSNNRCARCCHCHVSLALCTEGLVTVVAEVIQCMFRAAIKWRSGLSSKYYY